MTCDNLIAVDLVCADGALHRVSGTEQPELLWALRGGGGNFGIVTAFEFLAHPLGPDVMFCFVVYPDDSELMARYAAFIATEPEEIGTLAFTGTVPAADTFPRDSWGSPFFVVAACYAGPVAEGHRALQPLRELGTPIADLSAAMPFVEAQKFLDEEYPKGRHYYWKSVYLREFTPQVIDVLRHLSHRAPSPLSTIDIWTMGGALARVSSDDSPLAPRRAPFMIGIEANWERPDDDAANIEWVNDCVEALTPHAADGIYLNFPGFLENAEALVRSAYGANHPRLVRIKQQHDPDNFFRLNQNIKPL
jgi:FAD/FMN-containing dehydrogenase